MRIEHVPAAMELAFFAFALGIVCAASLAAAGRRAWRWAAVALGLAAIAGRVLIVRFALAWGQVTGHFVLFAVLPLVGWGKLSLFVHDEADGRYVDIRLLSPRGYDDGGAAGRERAGTGPIGRIGPIGRNGRAPSVLQVLSVLCVLFTAWAGRARQP